ncbi:MAG: hypothetical protein EZS28_010093 [Streblomastix strix]|uniref:Uncharacterized protein n=1 Tax=Streblomastix strix TaxID=222440 RepID=A0A5J4WHS9_9EUKA|nr:MAG: hypothetical protein EZS28_010093 [Streblomastix strix]
MAQLENELEDNKFFESILNQPTNVKHITIEKGAKRPNNRKSKVNEKANALMQQITNKYNDKDNEKQKEKNNEIITEVIDATPQNETNIELIIEQTIKDEHQKILSDLRNAEGDQETRLAKQQETYRLEKQWIEEDEYESKQKKKEDFDEKVNKVINEEATEDDKKKIAAKIAYLKFLQEE